VLLTSVHAAEAKKKLVFIAGKPSHPPRMHEFNAGVQLLARQLQTTSDLEVKVVLNGWPKDETVFEGADAIVFYMDGGGKHEVVKQNGRRLKLVDQWVKKGMGIGCMHYGVEVLADQAGQQFKKWIGGHYENSFSCNPMWEPQFKSFPAHPVANGVKPFAIKDEWYFNMRFIEGVKGNKPATTDGLKFTPILVATPSDKVRKGPYVYPRGPYPHIEAASGRPEAMMWAVERADGGRGFGFTGGHYHDNWGEPNFRKVVLNALVWVTGATVPKGGIESTVSKADLELDLDPKGRRK